MQAQYLLPVALPADPEALARLADAVAHHNRSLAGSQSTVPESSVAATAFSSEAIQDRTAAVGGQVRLTPWLAGSLAPVAAAVTIQAHWRGRAERQRQGPLGAQLLHRRAAVCIQRGWRICEALL